MCRRERWISPQCSRVSVRKFQVCLPIPSFLGPISPTRDSSLFVVCCDFEAIFLTTSRAGRLTPLYNCGPRWAERPHGERSSCPASFHYLSPPFEALLAPPCSGLFALFTNRGRRCVPFPTLRTIYADVVNHHVLSCVVVVALVAVAVDQRRSGGDTLEEPGRTTRALKK